MSFDEPAQEWPPEDIRRALEFLPVFESDEFRAQPYQWHGGETREEDGKKIISMPWVKYHPQLERFWRLFYESSAYLDPYRPLPEDGWQEGEPFSVFDINMDQPYLERATLNQIRRYLTLLSRGERFSEGTIAAAIDSRLFLAALHRLKALTGSH